MEPLLFKNLVVRNELIVIPCRNRDYFMVGEWDFYSRAATNHKRSSEFLIAPDK